MMVNKFDKFSGRFGQKSLGCAVSFDNLAFPIPFTAKYSSFIYSNCLINIFTINYY